MYNPQLDTFIQVAESGSFSKAGQALFVTPTAIIKQMNLLESRLGVTLFNRSHQGLTLTAAGRSLLEDAKHIEQYSQEAITRARMAERSEKKVVRVGVSLMTPTTYLTDRWDDIKKRCPGLSLQLVSFENTRQIANDILKNLGRDIDVVLGIFDDAFLARYGCLGLELEKQPLCCSALRGSELAQTDELGFEDLHGQKLMLIEQGWNESTDKLRALIEAEHPAIEIIDFPMFNASVYNQCANEDLVMATYGFWNDVHPMLKTVATNWGLSATYGLIYSPNADERTLELIEALKEEVDAPSAA